MQLVELMKVVELFRGLDDAQLRRLADITHSESYNEGDVILSLGKSGDKMYILGDGQVEVQLPARAKGTRPALYLGQGQIFGEISLLDGGNRSATVIAAQDNTTVYAIARDDFLRLCDSDKELGYLMMRNLALDLSFKLRHRNSDEL